MYKQTPNIYIARIIISHLLLCICLVSAASAQVPHIEWVSPSTEMEFTRIPSGCFKMGTEEGFKFESPVHEVCVDAFYLGQFEVTQEQWNKFMPENFSKFNGKSRPVERVSWNDAKNFIKKLNDVENTNKYPLPSEAEWEHAARG